MMTYSTDTRYCTQAIEPPCTERYARWCERSAAQLMVSLLLDLIIYFRETTTAILTIVQTHQYPYLAIKLFQPFDWISFQ